MKILILICVLLFLVRPLEAQSNTFNFPFTNVVYYGVNQAGTNSVFSNSWDFALTPQGSVLVLDVAQTKIFHFYQPYLLNFSTFSATPNDARGVALVLPNTWFVATGTGLYKTTNLLNFTQILSTFSTGVAYDQANKMVYVSNQRSHTVTAYDLDSFAVIRVYGSSAGTSRTLLKTPIHIALDKQGGLWVADYSNNRVVHFPPANATADIVLGQPDFSSASIGTAANPASLNGPLGIGIDPTNGNLYVSDATARVIRYTAPFTNGQNASGVIDARSDYNCQFIRNVGVRNNDDGSVRVIFVDNTKVVSGQIFLEPSTTASISATPTSTSSASVRGSLSATSASVTDSGSSSNSPSYSRTPFSSRSYSRTPSNSRSYSRTPSNSRSFSRTPSSTRSLSRTTSNSRSYSPTSTQTRSPTLSSRV